jgi:membrane protein insertase Oxa1/YidC/SpoIIIJ
MLLSMPILFAMFAVMREVANEKTVDMILGVKAALEAGNLDYKPMLEGFLWIKNVFQPDSFMSTVVPAASEQAMLGVTAFGALTQEMIDEAKAFLMTEQYANWAAAYGNNAMYSAPLLMWRITIPQSFNGLFVLPILSALTQFVATKFMNTNTPQPTAANPQQQSNQAMMKWFFPLFSLWICATSNAGFALYWVAANIIQVIQQLVINKWIDYSDSKKKLIEEAGK